MNKDVVINQLKKYACQKVADLAQHNNDLRPISYLLQNDFADIPSDTRLLTDDEAYSLTIIPTNTKALPPRVFDVKTRSACLDLAEIIWRIAAETRNCHDMVHVAKAVYPLLSQDSATFNGGFDLVECMDWYFDDDVPTAEKRQYAKELTDELRTVVEKTNARFMDFLAKVTRTVAKAVSTSIEELCERGDYTQTYGMPTKTGELIASELISLIAPHTDAELKATGDEWLFEDILEVAGRLDISVERTEDWRLLRSYLPRLRALQYRHNRGK